MPALKNGFRGDFDKIVVMKKEEEEEHS